MFDDKSPNRIINFRPLFIAAVGAIIGVALFETLYSAVDDNKTLAVLLLITAAVCGGLLVFGSIKGKKTLVVFAAAILLFLARASAASPDKIEKGAYSLRGTVSAVSETKSGVVTVSRAELNGTRLRYRVKLTVSDGSVPEVGDEIEASCEAKTPSRRFGSYDERLNLLSNGISATASTAEVTVISSGHYPALRALERVRSAIRDRIYRLFPDNAPIVAGFLIGDKSGVDESDLSSFRATGTAHLLSLSGFHVGVLTALLFFLLPKRFPWIRLVVVSLFLILYCAVAAFPPSLIRASVMCFCLMLSEVTEERRDPLSSLSLAALAVLFISPYELWSVGFRLSFAATLGILLIMSAGGANSHSAFFNRAASAAAVTIGASAATTLFTARYFGEFPTYGLAANLAVVPLFSVAITLSFIAVVLGFIIQPAGSIAAWAPDKLVSGTMLLVRRIEELPNSRIAVPIPSTLTCVIMLLMLFTISAYVLRPLRKRLLITLAVFLLFTASFAADIIRA